MITIPLPVVEVLSGGPIDPDDYVYGHGSPGLVVPHDVLYMDLDTRFVYSNQSGASMDSSMGSSTDTGVRTWVSVGDYSLLVSSTQLTCLVGDPFDYKIKFTRGNEKTWKFFMPGVCHMPLRPQIDGQDIPDPDPSDPLGITHLTVPWEERYWLSEVRDTYVSSARYFNGWVPFYGTWPNWVWWDEHSLKAVMTTEAEWDNVNKGTIVSVTIRSEWSKRIRPSRSYYWDLESAAASQKDDDGDPTQFNKIRTFVTGRCEVVNTWTIAESRALGPQPAGSGQTAGEFVLDAGDGDQEDAG